MRAIFVTGTDTGVGKTTLSVLLLAHLRSNGVHALGMKPFCSGSRSDAKLIRSSIDNELTLDEVNPFYFNQGIAPLAAARLTKRTVSLPMVLDKIDFLGAACQLLIMEGAGGLLSPLAEGVSALDLIAARCKNVIVVTSNKLGVLNHAQLIARALPHDISLRSTFVVMDSERPDESSGSNIELLSELLVPRLVVRWPRLNGNCEDPVYLKEAATGLRTKLDQVLYVGL